MSYSKRLLPVMVACLVALPALTANAWSASIETAFKPNTNPSTVTVDHSAWDKLLKAHVKPAENGLNRVDYKRFKSEGHKTLKSYVASLEKTDVSKLGRAEQFAFWVNIYNAKTIDIVLDKYPVKSIRDINLGGGLFAAITGGPWKSKTLTVQGLSISLDDVEHTILRGLFKDSRVHFAVNCASVGCPNLSRDAFTAAGLDAHLDRNASAYVNAPRGVTIEGGKVRASNIFSWFKADFGGSDETVLVFLKKYGTDALKSRLKTVTRIDDYFYDWSLNDVKG